VERDKLFTVAYLATAESTTAIDLVNEVAAISEEPEPLAKLIQLLMKRLPRKSVEFDAWDRVLRSDVTTATYDPPQDERHAYLWELKRQCLASTLQCLSVGNRLAFIVVDVLRVAEHEAAEILGTDPSALRARMTRARPQLADYLTPRCGHLNKRNACSCRGRLGIALRDDVIQLPIILAAPNRAHDTRARTVASLYRDLSLACPGGVVP